MAYYCKSIELAFYLQQMHPRREQIPGKKGIAQLQLLRSLLQSFTPVLTALITQGPLHQEEIAGTGSKAQKKADGTDKELNTSTSAAHSWS